MIRWIASLMIVAVLIVFCIMGTRIDRDITKPLKSALSCHTPGEAVCYFQEAQDQLIKRGWREEADTIEGLISQLDPIDSYPIAIRFADVKAELRGMVRWKGEGFPQPSMSHFVLIDKYRYGSILSLVWWVSIVLFGFTFYKEREPSYTQDRESYNRSFDYYT